jgi:two-component sensor histidine kinase
MRRLARALIVSAILALAAGASVRAAQPAARRVLIINSFGSRFAPFDTFASALRTEIARQSPGPVEFLETPLEIARSEQPEREGPFAQYVGALVADRRPDLIITIGGPAARFAALHRDALSASVPLLITGLDERHVSGLPALPNQAVVAFALHPTAVVENILRLRPDTTTLAVVLGLSPLERFWRAELERELAPFSARGVRLEWFNTLSLDEMRQRAAALPPHSAILFGVLFVDAAGVPREEDAGIVSLRAVANAPIFSPFESQLGKGIVGGPLLSVAGEGRRSATVALRILDGAGVNGAVVPPADPDRLLFDWRELHRWNIPERRLPPGSEVRFRPPSLWEAYRRPLVAGLGLVGLEAVLIGALLAQRARRRRAETQVRALNHRLLTAHEDERKLLARELHDDLSQRLARLSIDAARLEYAAAIPLDGGGHGPMREELARLSEDVHALAYQLHPSTLDDLGLAEALRVECDRFSRLESIAARLDTSDPAPEPSHEVALCLFRIAQEALRNVARHSRASAVILACASSDGGVRLSVRDDGSGFDLEAGRRGPSLGLAGMRERVDLVGGKIDIQSAPGRGTTVAVWVPTAAARPS